MTISRLALPAASHRLGDLNRANRKGFAAAGWWLCAGLALSSSVALAEQYPVTSGQRSTAQQVAQNGVPLQDLAPNAPDRYTIKSGDTLWDISSLFLKTPWRWPELWGMNLNQIRNPHLIYPGQVLVLTKLNGRATLSFEGQSNADGLPTVKLSPRVRAENLQGSAIPPIPLHVIEPFLSESLIVDGDAFERAPRIVATPESRVLLSRGDRAYARGLYGPAGGADAEALVLEKGKSRDFRVFRNATPLKDPSSGEVLGFEAQFVGKAQLARSETTREVIDPKGKAGQEVVPATIDITLSKEEMRVGDRLIPEPQREVPSYVPQAPATPQQGQLVAVHGSAVRFAGQNQVVIVNRGTRDGLQRGHVLALLKDSSVLPDKTDSTQPTMALPSERNGLMMVFRTFERVSYALVLQTNDAAKVGDRFSNP